MPAMPSDASSRRGWFDRFATAAERFASRAPFFALCVLLVMLWAPSYLIIGDWDTYQLMINTPTTIITFLLVALLQNTQHRADAAVQAKLNALAEALADLMATVDPDDEAARRELRAAVGLEERESS